MKSNRKESKPRPNPLALLIVAALAALIYLPYLIYSENEYQKTKEQNERTVRRTPVRT